MNINRQLTGNHMGNTHEEQIQCLQPLEPGVVQLVQITDCHIFATADEKLRGVDTRLSFEAVKKGVINNAGGLDLLLATGDLAEDGSADAYRYLAAQFDDFDAPTFWLPGNHDDSETMTQHFVGQRISATRQILAGDWLILLLDSTIAGEVYGRVADTQLDFMAAALNQYAHKHALVCLHHQAQQSGSEWIDEKGLRDDQQLRARLALHDNVRAVLWGHVHQEARQTIGGVEWMSTPSSCIQFKPNSKEFALSDEAPGYRHLRLKADGSVETAVHRIDRE